MEGRARSERGRPVRRAPVVLSVSRLRRSGVLDDLSFDVRAGEIVALAGLRPPERSDVLRLLLGLDPGAAGTVELDGARLEVRSPRDVIQRGIVLLPADGRVPGTSFGGGDRRAALFGLVSESRLLVADEPATAEVEDAVRAAAEGGLAVLIVAADVERVSGLAHRVLVLRHGRVAA